jgi:hypothetical protein
VEGAALISKRSTGQTFRPAMTARFMARKNLFTKIEV